jgi:hypothetical protein
MIIFLGIHSGKEDLENMTVSPEEVRWDLYPHVAIHPHAKAFIQWLVLNARRPKTIDAYARAIDHLENFSDSLALLSLSRHNPFLPRARFIGIISLPQQRVCGRTIFRFKSQCCFNKLVLKRVDMQKPPYIKKLTQAFPQCPLRGSRIVYDL